VLTEIANTDAIKSLVGIIEDENTDIADKAMMGIRKLGKKAVKSLIDAAGSGNIHMRRKATNLLGEIGELEAMEALISILENRDEDNELRGEAAEALGRIGDHTATAVLIRSVIDDEEYTVRCQSVMALGNVGDPDAGEALLTIVDCKDNPSRIRGLAFEALGKIGYKKAAKLLMDVLKDERNDSWLKDNAVWALGEMRINKSAPLIMKYIRDCWKFGYVDGIGKGIEALDKMGVFDIDR
jgi:HEAT repeat protein